MYQLLMIDFQRGMCDDDGPAGSTGLAAEVARREVLSAARDVLEAARDVRVDVAHVRLAFEPGFGNRTNRTERFGGHEDAGRFVLGSKETEFRSEVVPRDGEAIASKGSVSPFASTALLDHFLARGVKRLFVCGVATHLAVESATREAVDRGLEVTVIEDACASPTAELHDASINTGIASFARVLDAPSARKELSRNAAVAVR